MQQKSLKKNITYNLIRNVAIVLYPMITFPYASRVILPEGIGQVEFSNSIISIFIVIANMGIISYASREMARMRNNIEERKKFAQEIFILNLITTFIAYAFFIIAVYFIPSIYEYRKLLFICSGRILFTVLGVEWLYTAFEDYDYITFRSIAFQIISFFLLFIFVRDEDDYIWYAGIGVFSSVGSNICNFIHSKKYVFFLRRGKLELKKHLKPIFIFFGMSVSGYVYTMLDTTMLGFFTDDAVVGYYTAANKINRIVLTLITAISSVMFSRMSYLLGDGNNKEEMNSLIQKSLDFIVCFSIPCVVGLIVLSPQIILLFCGSDFFPAIFPMKILTPVLFIWSFASILCSTVLLPMRKEKYVLFSQITGALLNFTMNFVLIQKIGLLGAIISTLIAETSVTTIQLLSVRKIIINKHFFKNIFQVIFASIIMYSVIFFINKMIENVLLNILYTIMVGCISYIVVLFFLKNDLCIYIITVLKRKEKKK